MIVKLKKILLFILVSNCLTCFGQPPESNAIKELAERIVPQWSGRLIFEKVASEKDRFELESRDGKLIVYGNNNNSMATGLNYYLKNYCHTSVSWYKDDPIELPQQMPVLPVRIKQEARCQNRFFLNYCTFGYSMPWWKWKDWERLIDWMALNGVNMPLAISGQEAVWYKVWRQLGLSDFQIRSYFTGPSFLPWHRMANIDSWGGPLPKDWINGQVVLQKKILKRERELNMKPVLPAFAGHVPAALKSIFPAAKITSLGSWAGFSEEYQSYFLDPLDPQFQKIQKSFLEEQTKLFGTDHIYGADPFNEVTPPSWDPAYLATVSREVFHSMSVVDTSARWLQMGWLFFYNRKNWTNERIDSFLRAVPRDKMILLDYYDEKEEVWKLTNSFFGQPYIWCYLGNFGGNTVLAGNLAEVESRMEDAFRNGGSNLWGIGSTLEGLNVNQVMYEYVLEKAWSNGPTDVDQWIRNWVMRRCGKADKNVEEAWEVLLNKVYVSPTVNSFPIMNVRPGFKGQTKKSDIPLEYENKDLLEAWRLLLNSDSKERASYKYDLVNIGRQVLVNYFSVMRDKFTVDYEQRNFLSLKSDSIRMMELFTDLDSLVGTQSSFLLGKWLSDAKSFGKNQSEKHYYEKDARTILTTWGKPGQRALNDYANRSWSGLINDFYAVRWEMFIHNAMNALRENVPFDKVAFNENLNAFESKWIQKNEKYPNKPSGDAIQISKRLFEKYAPEINNKKYNL
ncbi:MAG: alpha-N-acetylglucosaminidase [Ginsengibacter sp.]